MNQAVTPPWDADEEIGTPVTGAARKLADEIFSAIVAGEYEFGTGTRLPSERMLADAHNVSRATVRQSLGMLERHDVVARRAGSGSIVRYKTRGAQGQAGNGAATTIDLTDLAQSMSPLELGVVRSIIEPEIARLAVLSMTSRDIEAMKDVLAEIEKVTTDGEQFSTLDDELRMQIARGTHNPMLVAISTMITFVSRSAHWSLRRRKTLTPARIKEYQLQDRSLCDAIENRDIEAAVEYLKLSLADFHRDLLRGA